MLAPYGLQRLGIGVQLLQVVGQMDQGDVGKDHALVAGAQIVQELLCLAPQLLQLIGNGGRKVVLIILALLPTGNVALDAQYPGLDFLYRLVGGDGQNVNGKHEVPGEVGQLRNHAVLDIAGILPKEQNTSHLAAHLEVVGLELHPIRGNVVPKIMAFFHSFREVELEVRLLSGPEKVMKQPQPLMVIQGPCPTVQPSEALTKVCIHPAEKGTGFLNVFSRHGDGDILILDQAVAVGGLFRENGIVFLAVSIQPVAPAFHQDTALEVHAIQAPVVDGDFGGGVGGQTVQDAAIGGEHIPLVLVGRQGVVNIREAPGATVLIPHLPDTVPEDAPDRDGLLDAAGYLKAFLFTSVGGSQSLNHRITPPFQTEPYSRYFPHGTPWAQRIGTGT